MREVRRKYILSRKEFAKISKQIKNFGDSDN